MAEASFILAVLCWGLLPGLALASALGLGWTGVERAAGAAGMSLAIVAAAAYAAELVGLPVSPFAVGGVVAVGCALAALSRRFFDRPRPAAPPLAPDWLPAARPRWAPWLVLLFPVVVVQQLEPIWSAQLLLPPTLYDGLDHANWFRLVLETRSVNPAEVLAPPLNPDGSATYYPWGLHAWLALVAGTTTTEPMVVFFRGLIALSAALPLSVYVFAAHFTGRGWAALTAAALSLLFWWLPYQVWGWGGYALLAGAVAALPVSRLAIDAVRADRADEAAAAAICGIGLLVVHPSQALSALIICATTTVVLAAGRAAAWRHAVPFVLAFAAAGVALAFGGLAWNPVAAFMERASDVGTTLADDPRYRWPLAVYAEAVWQTDSAGRVGLAALYVAGALVALRHAALRPVLALHVVFSLMMPLAEYRTWLTSLWYHAPERIWYLQYATLPILGALGVAGVLQVLDRLTRRRLSLRRRQVWVWPAAALAFMLAVHGAFADRASIWLWRFANRSLPMPINDARLLADFQWMRDHIPASEVLFNAAADWGVSLPFTGHRTVFWSGGRAITPTTNWHLLQELMNRGGSYTSHAAREARWHGLRFVYAARVDGRLATGGRRPFDVTALASAASLDRLYASPTAEVFRIRDEGSDALGLADSARLHLIEGFYGAERSATPPWRWTNGHGRFRLTPDAPPDRDCFVRVLGADPDAYRLELDGTALAFTPRGHRVPPRPSGRPAFELDLVSAAAVPADTGTGTDDRLLGIRVFDLTLHCPG
jgi:hypothetical protein